MPDSLDLNIQEANWPLDPDVRSWLRCVIAHTSAPGLLDIDGWWATAQLPPSFPEVNGSQAWQPEIAFDPVYCLEYGLAIWEHGRDLGPVWWAGVESCGEAPSP